MLSVRDPIHGFIRADPLEAALLNSRPLQRLRFIHQLGFAFHVFPGAEHSRFSHLLGAMELAGRVYDALADKNPELLEKGNQSRGRRLIRATLLVHDIGHAPFSHSAEELFEGGIDHEQMSQRLLSLPEIEEIFERHGDGLRVADVAELLAGKGDRLLRQVLSSELDADKMDYLLRDSLYCGVRYGSYDLDRLLDTIIAIPDPESGSWGIGVTEGGIHALEALVLARYYMFTQVYFNLTGKALELHFNEWLRQEGRRWPADPERFLVEDDISVLSAMRQSRNPHAEALVERRHFPLAFETREHLTPADKERFESILPALIGRFGAEQLLISNSAKDPHRFAESRIWVRLFDGTLEPVTETSQFIGHLSRIDRYRVYAPNAIAPQVAEWIDQRWRHSEPERRS